MEDSGDGGGIAESLFRQLSGDHPLVQDMQAANFVPNIAAVWGQDQDGVADGYSPDSYTGEWPETRDTQNDDLDYPEDLKKSAHSFILCCGAEEPHPPPLPTTPRIVSPLPAYPWRTLPLHAPPKSNGCGAIIHTAAVPQKRCGVWMATLGSTDVVTEMDSQYFDRSDAVRMMKSPCGCEREGIGCRLCGNSLGMRYRPCTAAVEGLFSTAITPSHPNHPSDPAYWCNPPSLSLTSTCYVYTLFPDRVSSFSPLHMSSSLANVQPIAHSATKQPSGTRFPTNNLLPSQSYSRSELDADGNPIGEPVPSPDEVTEAWPGH